MKEVVSIVGGNHLRPVSLTLVLLMFMLLFAASTISASAQSTTVTISTDKPAYQPGEPIQVSGKVAPIQSNTFVSFTLIAPNGNIQVPLAVLPDASGAYSATISQYNVPKEGTYRLVATYGLAKAEVKISIGGSAKDGLSECDLQKYVCVLIKKFGPARSKYQSGDPLKDLVFSQGEKIDIQLWVTADRRAVKEATLEVSNGLFKKKYTDADFIAWPDVQTAGGGLAKAKYFVQTIKISDNANLGKYIASFTAPGTPSSFHDQISFEVTKKPAPPPPVTVGMYLKGGKGSNKDTIVNLVSNGAAITKFIMLPTPKAYGGLDARGGGWTCSESDSKGTITCVTGDPLYGKDKPKNKLFKFARQTLDSIKWEAYDTNGAKVGSGTAKR